MYKIRASILPSWNDCPRREALKVFIQDIKELGWDENTGERKNNVAAAVGTGLHKGAETALKDKMHGRDEIKLSDATEMSIWGFRQECREGINWDDLTPNANTGEKQLQQMTKTYWNMFLPKVNPVSIEESMKARTPAYELSGHSDIIEDIAIRDTKTGRMRKYHAQLGGYSLLAKANKIITPKKLIIDFLPRAMTKNPKILPQSYEYDVDLAEKEARAVLKIIEMQHAEFERTGDMRSFPCNPSSVLCSPKWCGGYASEWCPITK